MATILLSIAVLGAAVALIAVRLFFVRDGEFRGTCATNNPYLPELRRSNGECWACGEPPGGVCPRPEEEHASAPLGRGR